MKDLVAQILSPQRPIKLGKKTYWVKQNVPWELKIEAKLIYEKTLDQFRFSGMFRRTQVEPLLKYAGVPLDELEPLAQNLEQLKVDLYKKYNDTFSQKPIRSQIKSIKKQLSDISYQVAALDNCTLEAYAEKMGALHILRNQYSGPKSFNFVNKLYFKFLERCITIETVRKIARDEYWRSVWMTKKGGVFRVLPLTDEQLSLASYSRMYENILKHPECPPMEVIEDDDMLDGWLLTQNKGQKKQTFGSKIDSAQEVFIMAKDQKQADQIYAMNTDEQRAIQNVRAKQLQKSGAVRYHEFADQQRKLGNAAR